MKYPRKTDSGREALRLRDPALNARDRQILVLANGERAFQELAGMVGLGGAAAMERLAELGFLSLEPPVAPASTASSAAHAVTVAKVARPAPPPEAAALERRSSAAAKMYLIDMLAMIRGPEATTLAALVHGSRSETELLDRLEPVLERIAQLTRPSYALRICQHLQTLLPQSAQARLTALAQGLESERLSLQ
ncbi:hypothetical protein [Paucibacter sp. B51]|uniref:hypothetical protein n=1 Tax=Paucibacter sp. B51 TaxID=2993315 RepID=UPI0022EBCC7C|nr:hypothetical protein [Paucibacter sp. B51]